MANLVIILSSKGCPNQEKKKTKEGVGVEGRVGKESESRTVCITCDD